MTIKQTNASLIIQYGSAGIELFDEIEALLVGLVNDTATVPYRGQNAFAFKTKATTHAVDFAASCATSMQQISQVITESTSYISQALGGNPITLDAPSSTIAAPPIDDDLSVQSADSTPLRALQADVNLKFDQIKAKFEQNVSNLQALGAEGWIGPEYDDAYSNVVALTNAITDDVDNAKKVLSEDIENQLNSLNM